MFPDTGGENEEGMKAADDIVRERARIRRKQLLEEEMEIRRGESSEMEVELEILTPSTPPKPAAPKKSRPKRGKAGSKAPTDTSENERDMEMIVLDEPQILTQRPPTAKSRKPTSGYRSDASNISNSSVASRTSTRSMTRKKFSEIHTHMTQPSDPLPVSQPPRRQESASSYRTKTPSDHSSDVEVISDHSARSTRSRTRDGTKAIPQPPHKNSKSTGKRSMKLKSTHVESTPDTDPDDELLNSSPFNVRRHLSQRTLSTELGDLDVDETPKPQKIGSMKLNLDPWRVQGTPTREVSRRPTPKARSLLFSVPNLVSRIATPFGKPELTRLLTSAGRRLKYDILPGWLCLILYPRWCSDP